MAIFLRRLFVSAVSRLSHDLECQRRQMENPSLSSNAPIQVSETTSGIEVSIQTPNATQALSQHSFALKTAACSRYSTIMQSIR
ncbi:hypothetical protein OH492_13005 [Vibrio chagasii]|nr:hypothetical protein [Vibrio chagasii]